MMKTIRRGVFDMNEQTTITTVEPQPTALLMGGGGAKGAFQIGVWQALMQTSLLDHITTVAGCSVGALNAVLFALGDLSLAKSVWLNIEPNDLLAFGANGAFFSREGLVRIIDRLPLDRVRNSSYRIIVSVCEAETNQTAFFELNGLPDQDIRTLLLATSAIPHIYEPVRYLGKNYRDGGVTADGELCVKPAYHKGHRDMLMVSLRSAFSLYGGRSGGLLREATGNLHKEYPDCNFTVIKPMKPLGNLLTGTLNFTKEKIQQSMVQGYMDTRTALAGSIGKPQTLEEINAELVKVMKRLFPNSVELLKFIQVYQDRFAPNIPFPTLGGSIWYDNIFAVDGWRLQQMRTAGLQRHYRILDANDQRVAWVLDPMVLLDTMLEYENQK